MAVLTGLSLGIRTVLSRVALGAAAVHAEAAIRITSTSKIKGRRGAGWALMNAATTVVTEVPRRTTARIVIRFAESAWRRGNAHHVIARMVDASGTASSSRLHKALFRGLGHIKDCRCPNLGLASGAGTGLRAIFP